MIPCAWCGRPTKPVEGAFLEALYPGEFSCLGCGRRTLHCECEPIVPTGQADATMGAQIRLHPFVARRAGAGWKARAIATAAGVSLRTAYRYLKAKRTEDIRVGDHVATFVVREDQPPARISEWRQA